MDTIANDSDTYNNIMQPMMNSNKGKRMMTNHENTMKMRKHNPDMIKGIDSRNEGRI